MFALAQQRLEKNQYAPSTYKADDKYLLSTKLICGDCGSYMVGESGTGGSGKKYHYYKCTTAKKKGDCHRKALRKDDVEELALNKIVNSVFDGNVINELANHVSAWQENVITSYSIHYTKLYEVWYDWRVPS